MVGFHLSRSQIAKIVGNDPEAIKQFERFFAQSKAQVTEIDDLVIAAGVANGKANEALATLQRIADALETLAVAPLPQPAPHCDDLFFQPPRQPVAKRYGSFYSTATQTAASPNTAYAVTFNTTDISFGVSVASSSRITPDNGGLFLIDYTLHLHETSGVIYDVYSWLRVNGADVTYSGMHTKIEGNGTETAAGSRHILRLARGDYVEVMWATSSTAIQISVDAASAFAPACPSARVTITDNLEEVSP